MVDVSDAETEEYVCKMTTSALAFDTMSSSLYADRVSAIIRELSCNAYDSHVAAGCKDRPFDIHLPTEDEPWFMVRDYGTALQDEAVFDLFFDFFSSNKQKTNKQIGGFGIGSKSPFSYVREHKREFFVIVRMCGEKRTYKAYINQDGLPAAVRESTEPTDEETGIEVRFDVQEKDNWEFRVKAERVLEFFEPLPNINFGIDVDHANYKLEGKRWKLRGNHGYNRPRVIMGMVPYKVEGLKELELTEEEQMVLSMPLDIFVPIGTVSPAATRESLTNDKSTVEKLRSLMFDIYGEMEESIAEKLGDYESGWAKLKYLRSFSNSPLAPFVTKLKEKVVQDQSVFSQPTLKAIDFPGLMVRSYTKNYHSTSSTDLMKDGSGSIMLNDDYGLLSNSDIEFMFIDRPVGGDTQAREYIKSWGYGSGKQLVALFPSTAAKIAFSMEAFLAEAVKFINALGGPSYILLSSLPQPEKPVVVKGPPVRSVVYTWAGSSFTSCWDRTTTPVPTEGVQFYVRTMYGKPIDLKDSLDSHDLKKWLIIVRGMPFTDFSESDSLYSFVPSQKIPSGAKWVDLVAHVIERAIDWAKENPQKRISNLNVLENCCNLQTLRQYVHEMGLSSLYREACEFLREAEKETFEDHGIGTVFAWLKDDAPSTEYQKTITSDEAVVKCIAKKVMERYPLVVSNNWADIKLSMFYINSIDERVEREVVEGSWLIGEAK
jgi:hypothetical protein